MVGVWGWLRALQGLTSYRAFSMMSKVRIAQVRRMLTAAILVYSLTIEIYGATEES